jgi:hypothetical protein
LAPTESPFERSCRRRSCGSHRRMVNRPLRSRTAAARCCLPDAVECRIVSGRSMRRRSPDGTGSPCHPSALSCEAFNTPPSRKPPFPVPCPGTDSSGRGDRFRVGVELLAPRYAGRGASLVTSTCGGIGENRTEAPRADVVVRIRSASKWLRQPALTRQVALALPPRSDAWIRNCNRNTAERARVPPAVVSKTVGLRAPRWVVAANGLALQRPWSSRCLHAHWARTRLALPPSSVLLLPTGVNGGLRGSRRLFRSSAATIRMNSLHAHGKDPSATGAPPRPYFSAGARPI